MSFYVTTPIYYVNAAPHLGHAYTAIAADVLARHHRQRGEEVFFLTGTDEHGEPVAMAAEAAGVTPRALADQNAVRFQALTPLLGLTNDFFVRTSDPRHHARVQEILTTVRDNGYVYEGTYEGWYCPRCADFKTETEIGPDNTCPIHHIPLIREHEDNWFFKLSAFQEPLETLFAEYPEFVAPRHRYNEAKAFIERGLQDVSLSRSRLSWGVPVPWDPAQVFYVWWDALLNYVTALSFAGETDRTAELWPATVQLIGKDILKFHTIYWPALLMAAGLPLPEQVFVHGFLLSDGEKMSKSRGSVIDPFEVIDEYSADALRFYLMREVRFGTDGPVDTAGFVTRYESELANDFGNLASRTIAMVRRYRDGDVPDVPRHALDELASLPADLERHLDEVDLTGGLERVWTAVRRLNRYVEEQAPWALAKDPEKAGELDKALATLAEGLRVIAVVLHAYLPESTTTLLAALGTPDTGLATAGFGGGPRVAHVEELAPLFPKSK